MRVSSTDNYVDSRRESVYRLAVEVKDTIVTDAAQSAWVCSEHVLKEQSAVGLGWKEPWKSGGNWKQTQAIEDKKERKEQKRLHM